MCLLLSYKCSVLNLQPASVVEIGAIQVRVVPTGAHNVRHLEVKLIEFSYKDTLPRPHLKHPRRLAQERHQKTCIHPQALPRHPLNPLPPLLSVSKTTVL